MNSHENLTILRDQVYNLLSDINPIYSQFSRGGGPECPFVRCQNRRDRDKVRPQPQLTSGY